MATSHGDTLIHIKYMTCNNCVQAKKDYDYDYRIPVEVYSIISSVNLEFMGITKNCKTMNYQ